MMSYVESKKDTLREIESRLLVVSGWGWENWGDISQKIEMFRYTINKFGDLMYTMVIIANNMVSHT